MFSPSQWGAVHSASCRIDAHLLRYRLPPYYLVRCVLKLPPLRPSFIKPMYVHALVNYRTGICGATSPSSTVTGAWPRSRPTGLALWSRRGNVFTDRFRDVANTCQQLPHDTVIDAKWSRWGDDRRASFKLLQHSRFTAHEIFMIFSSTEGAA